MSFYFPKVKDQLLCLFHCMDEDNNKAVFLVFSVHLYPECSKHFCKPHMGSMSYVPYHVHITRI